MMDGTSHFGDKVVCPSDLRIGHVEMIETVLDLMDLVKANGITDRMTA